MRGRGARAHTTDAVPSGRHNWLGSPWVRRFGTGAFLFFTIKGLLWLLVPALVWWISRS